MAALLFCPKHHPFLILADREWRSSNGNAAGGGVVVIQKLRALKGSNAI